MMDWKCSSFEFDTTTPVVMGILNVTPDSFSDGGRFSSGTDALAAARKMLEQGARIIDVGGESTRRGAQEVSPDEELARVLPVVRCLAREGVCVSIDTRHAEVARECLKAGASVVNDVSGFRDAAMVDVVSASDCGLVVVHCAGERQASVSLAGKDAATKGFAAEKALVEGAFATKGSAGEGSVEEGSSTKGLAGGVAPFTDVVVEVRDHLANRARELEERGIDPCRICLDPGPGFGKDARQTTDVVRNFHEFARLGYPLMAALSRKSFLGEVYGIKNPQDRDEVSAAEALMACELGAGIVRTHNVPCTCAALRDLRPYVYIGLGCNMVPGAAPDSPQNTTAGKKESLNRALAALCVLPDSFLVDVSGFYESEPAYKEDQPPFVNAVALLRTGLPPKELIACLHAIEDQMGRVRTVENGPRTCDLDILDYQRYVVESDELTLPHPRVLEREFTVKPLLELHARHILADGTPVILDGARFGKSERLL